MALYIKYPKDSTKKLLDLIDFFIKVAGYKINVRESVALLYTNNEKAAKEIRKTILIIIASKNITRNEFLKEGERPLHENNKTLKKELEL
jgi:hypothetical protein